MKTKAVIDGMGVDTFVKNFNKKCTQNKSFSSMNPKDRAEELDRLIKEYIFKLSPGGQGLYRVLEADITKCIERLYGKNTLTKTEKSVKQQKGGYATDNIMGIAVHTHNIREKKLVESIKYNIECLQYWVERYSPDRFAESAKKVRAQIDILMQMELIGMNQYQHLLETYQIYVDDLIQDGNEIRRKKGMPVLKDKHFHGII